jgi:hypothetical protein
MNSQTHPKADLPRLHLSHDLSVSYAFQQNAIPVIKELRFQNDSKARKDLVLRVSTEPAFASPVEIRIQAIEADGEFRMAPLDLKLSHDLFSGLNEKVSGWLKVEVTEAGSIVCVRTEPIVLLARNEWCGLVALPEILAAFVLPNDPAVLAVLGRAAEFLRDATGRAALDGYQDRSRRRAWCPARRRTRLRRPRPPCRGCTSRFRARGPPRRRSRASARSRGRRAAWPARMLGR